MCDRLLCGVGLVLVMVVVMVVVRKVVWCISEVGDGSECVFVYCVVL